MRQATSTETLVVIRDTVLSFLCNAEPQGELELGLLMRPSVRTLEGNPIRFSQILHSLDIPFLLGSRVSLNPTLQPSLNPRTDEDGH